MYLGEGQSQLSAALSQLWVPVEPCKITWSICKGITLSTLTKASSAMWQTKVMASGNRLPFSVHLLSSIAPPPSHWIGKKWGTERKRKCAWSAKLEHWRIEREEAGGTSSCGGQHLACYLRHQEFLDQAGSSKCRCLSKEKKGGISIRHPAIFLFPPKFKRLQLLKKDVWFLNGVMHGMLKLPLGLVSFLFCY